MGDFSHHSFTEVKGLNVLVRKDEEEKVLSLLNENTLKKITDEVENKPSFSALVLTARPELATREEDSVLMGWHLIDPLLIPIHYIFLE